MGKGALHPAKRKRRPQRKSPKYTPPEEEEYLSAAIQEASYTQLEAITNPESIKDAFLIEGFVFVEMQFQMISLTSSCVNLMNSMETTILLLD